MAIAKLILYTVPATVKGGGLWYDSDASAINLFHDGKIYAADDTNHTTELGTGLRATHIP